MNIDSSTSAGRLEAIRFHHPRRIGRGEILEQRPGGVSLSGAGADGSHKVGVILNFRRQRARQFRARLVQDFAYLRHPEFDFAVGDRLGAAVTLLILRQNGAPRA